MNLLVTIKKEFFNQETRPNFLISILWAPVLFSIFIAIGLRLPFLDMVAPYIVSILTMIAILFSWQFISKKIKPIDLVFYVLVFTTYILQFLFYPQNSEQLEGYFVTALFTSVPMYFFGLLIDINSKYKMLFVLSILSVIYIVVHTILDPPEKTDDPNIELNYIGFAYEFLPHALYSTWYLLRNRFIYSIPVILISLFMLISFGARGAIACYVLYLCYLMTMMKFKHKTLILSSLGVLCLYVIINLTNIVLKVGEIIMNLGLSARITNQVIDEEIASDSGRGWIIETLVKQLETNENFFGYGLFGSWRYVGGYSHRIYIDFLFNFGYCVGGILIVSLCYLIFKAYRSTCDNLEREFLVLLVCYSIVKLMFSGYFLLDPSFFILLGYCVSLSRNKRIQTLSIRR